MLNFFKASKWRLLGLGFWQAWQMVTLCTMTVMPSITEGDIILSNSSFALLVCMTFSYAFVIFASKRRAPFTARKSSYLWTSCLMSIGTLLIPLGIKLSSQLGALVFIIGAISASLGNAFLLIMWGELWSNLANGRVGQHLYASYTFAFVLYFMIIWIPWPLSLCITAALPVASSAILFACRAEPKRTSSVVPLDVKTIPTLRLLVCIFFISTVWGYSQGIVGAFNTSGENFMNQSLLLAGLAIGAITLSMILNPSLPEPLALYRPVIPAMFAGILLSIMLPHSLSFVGNGLIVMGVYCLDMLMMLVTTDIAFRSRIPVALTFGVTILIARLGTFCGTVGAVFLPQLTLWSELFMDRTLLLCVLGLGLIGMLFFTFGDIERQYEIPYTPKQEDRSQLEKCHRIAHSCSLSPRETEVLILLAQGRSVPYICEKLSIAKGTAKHHVSNIYRKIGVYDRQGLLDVIELGGVGKGTQ